MSAAERPTHAVFVHGHYLDTLLEERRRLGIDRWDEMWEGVPHLSPPPSHEHSRILFELIAFLQPLVRRKKIGFLNWGAVRDPAWKDRNYRTPDLSFISNERASVVGEACWLDAGPDVAFEVCSPGDETYQKKGFYAQRGTRELVVIHRDSKHVELYRPPSADDPIPPDADGSVLCEGLGVRFRRAERPGGAGVLEAWDAADPAQRVEI